ncbi:Transcriptional regulatory protein ros [Starkeya nomas]|uniref:Transcriptional regulatory protein ros n=2 Tax=Xanthobacteraceae TaxID=335928 RepID=A0A5S9NCY4_9HYPH|nr:MULTISPECIES: MucR family transcriptional regulator [Xanthobacteraceae]TSJ62263.1 MucR family transcriptional regulator [Ancylobacter moscoviensis]CAA0087980.1 Transcriptional regulatory protein ros [Starkeya nomas]
MSDTKDADSYIELAADIVSAYVSNNAVSANDLTALIGDVHGALQRVDKGQAEPVVEPLKPAVPVKKSVMPDYIVCLEDGKKFKSLKRHLRTQYNLTPEEYREKWGLPSDYPMVAPNYAAARSALAKEMGLGQQRRRSARG